MKRTIYDCWNCRYHNSDNPYGIDYCEIHDTRCSFANDDCDNFEPDTDTGGNERYPQPPRRLTLIGWYLLAIVFAVLLGWLLMGCTTTKYVPIYRHTTDTVRITQHHRDSIYLSDSIYVSDFVRDDTVYKTIDRWHTRYVERTRTDTVYQSRTDSIPMPYPAIKEVPAELTWWQQARLHMANIVLILLAVACVVCAVRLYLKNRLPH
jgi:hypothetical protein